MRHIGDWRGREIGAAQSTGSRVVALVDYADGMLTAELDSWPPPEILQKLYKSRQSRAFSSVDVRRLSDDLCQDPQRTCSFTWTLMLRSPAGLSDTTISKTT